MVTLSVRPVRLLPGICWVVAHNGRRRKKDPVFATYNAADDRALNLTRDFPGRYWLPDEDRPTRRAAFDCGAPKSTDLREVA